MHKASYYRNSNTDARPDATIPARLLGKKQFKHYAQNYTAILGSLGKEKHSQT